MFVRKHCKRAVRKSSIRTSNTPMQNDKNCSEPNLPRKRKQVVTVMKMFTF